MSIQDSLIATRKRRSNAGSRLKQLLQAEEIANVDEDDENVDLLFQEDEDDDEFQIGDKDKYGYDPDAEGDESEDEEQDDNGETKASEGEEENDDEDESEVEVQENDDEMFSDSEDDSDDASDSDEGEKELQKQERAKKRAAQKKSRQAPQIKTRPKAAEIKKPKPKHQSPKAEELLSLTRRQSSRKTAVENKLQLVNRLKDDELRRQNTKQVVQKVEYVEMTQEERLQEAIETEKFNITQLNKYKEQEIDKQAKRRALQLSKRKKIENMVTFKSAIREVPLIEEIKYEIFLQNRDKLKKKDRRGRKSDKQKREEEEERLQELERKKRLEEMENQMRLKRELLEAESRGGDAKRIKAELEGAPIEDDVEMKDVDDKQTTDNDNSLSTTPAESGKNEEQIIDDVNVDNESPEEKGDTPSEDSVKEKFKIEETITTVERSNPETPTIESISKETTVEPAAITSRETTVEPTESTSKEASAAQPESSSVKVKQEQIGTTDSVPLSTDLNTLAVNEDIKKVTFDLINTSTAEPQSSRATTVNLESSAEPMDVQPDVYEGPLQKVGYNTISFENKLKADDLKVYLFGEESLLPATRRLKETEPLFRIKNTSEDDNPFATTKLIEEIKIPDLSVLDAFPSFGTYTTQVKVKPIEQTNTKVKITINTAPPTGITLPNGNKKVCLITGKPCVYFDPKSGIPYSSVESYKFIQKLEMNEFKWCDFPKGGAYVNAVGERHAKGVPEGFDE